MTHKRLIWRFKQIRLFLNLFLVRNFSNKLLADENKGILRYQHATLERNIINEDLLQLIDKLDKEDKTSTIFEKIIFYCHLFFFRYGVTILLFWWVSLIIISVIAYILPQKELNVKIKYAVDKIKFKTKNASPIYINEYFSNLYHPNFEIFQIPAKSLILKEDSKVESFDFQGGFIKIYSNRDESSESQITLEDSIFLQQLNLAPNTIFSLSLEKNHQINIETEGQLEGIIITSDSLKFQTFNTQMQYNEQLISAAKENLKKGIFYSTQGNQIQFKSKQKNSDISLQSYQSITFNSTRHVIQAADISFTKPNEIFGKSAVSSIKSAHIYFLDNRDICFDSIYIKEYDYLILTEDNNMQFVKLEIKSDAIEGIVKGQIADIKSGSEINQLFLRNPSVLSSFWYNYTKYIISVFVLILLFHFVIFYFRKKARLA